MNKLIIAGLGALAFAGYCSVCCDRCAGGDYAATIDEGFENQLGYWGFDKWEGATEIYTNGPDPDTNRRGVLTCCPEKKLPAGKRADLYTKKEYRNFILRFEYFMPENGNNGVGIRMVPGQPASYNGMCEVQLLDDGGSEYYDLAKKCDKLKPYQYTGSVYGVVPAKRDNVDRQLGWKSRNFAAGGSYARSVSSGIWNFEEIRVAGEEIEVYLNGYLVTKADLSKFKGDGDTPDGKPHPGLHNARGRIGFLGHGTKVKFRNVRIRELPDDAKMGDLETYARPAAPAGFETFFSGDAKQLRTMWKGVTTEEKFDRPHIRQAATPAKRAEMQKKADLLRDAHWSVRNGALYFDGFKGGYSLATIKDFGDFEMWADWRIMSVTGDSGIYPRGVCQIQIWDAHNEWNIGSGGLFNNKKNPSDATSIADREVGDWNRFHVKMVGEKVTVWLNGVKVVDNVTLENRVEPDKPVYASEQIELQCHGDPLEWKNVFIRPL